MIQHLQIRNFKGWSDSGRLRLAPLTVFFGANSAGKSSIGQFLMMLKQTADSGDRETALLLGGAPRTIVDLGIWSDVIHSHDEDSAISFELQWKLPQELSIEDGISDTSYSGDILSLASEIRRLSGNGESSQQILCTALEYSLKRHTPNGESVPILGIKMGRKKKNRDKIEFDIRSEPFAFRRKEGRGWPLPSPYRFYGFPKELNSYYQNAQDSELFSFAVESLLQRVSYLGPLRAFPKRQYIWSGSAPADVGQTGENWLSAYLSAKDRCISPGMAEKRSRKAQAFPKIIGRWLKEIGLIHDFKAESISPGAREYRGQVKVGSQSQWVDLPDVGFGISQFMPILVECFYAPRDSIIVIEQPELHLHPSIQQNLADLLIEVIQSREDGEPRNIQLLIESHSEHFLNRLQRRIAEQKIESSEVASYFFSQSNTGKLKATPLEVDSYGNIANWPENFFGDSFTDVVERQKAGLKRRLQEKES